MSSTKGWPDHSNLHGKGAISEEAKQDAIRDVYGSCNVKNFDEGEAMLASARNQLEEAMRMLPHDGDTREAYDEAMQKCPQLVEMESNPVSFLRAMNYDPWATAKRIVHYWKWRKKVFGPERAFLPMTLLGDGALSTDDVEAFKCGRASIWPPDQHNRPVLFLDRGKSCERCHDPETRARILFYLLQVLFDSDLGQKHGFVGINAFSTSQSTNKPDSKGFEVAKSGAIPIKINAFHMLVVKKRSMLDSCAGRWFSLAARLGLMPMRMMAHSVESKNEALSKLKPFGLLEKHTPTELGGVVDFGLEFQRWCAHRVHLERRRYAAAAPPPADRITSGPLPTQGSLHVSLKRVREDEAKSRHRKLCKLYQQKKREQFKQDKVRLEDQIAVEQQRKAQLETEHKLLQSLWDQAVKFIENYETKQRLQQDHHQLRQLPGETPAPVPAQMRRDQLETDSNSPVQQRQQQQQQQSRGCAEPNLLERYNQQTQQNAVLVQMVEKLVAENSQLRRRQGTLDERIELCLRQQQRQQQELLHLRSGAQQQPHQGGSNSNSSSLIQAAVLQGLRGDAMSPTAATAGGLSNATSLQLQQRQQHEHPLLNPLSQSLSQNPNFGGGRSSLSSLLQSSHQNRVPPSPAAPQQLPSPNLNDLFSAFVASRR